MNSQIAICRFKKQNYNNIIDHVEDTEFGTSEYSYLTDSKTFKKGDILVVETKYGLELAKFEKYSKLVTDMEKATRWVIQKVDLTQFVDRREKAIQRETLLRQMREIKDSSMELEIFATLAKSSPQMADLLAKFNSI